MTKILIYNNDKNIMETYFREENEPMPYNQTGSLLVGEFRGSSKSPILWSSKEAMDTFEDFRKYYGKPIYVGYAFKRIWEGGHGNQSQHYAGTSFDTGQNLSTNDRNALYNSAKDFGRWTYVEPNSLTPTWVHFDKRYGNPACPTGGYPVLRAGDKGVYVLILQDALNALGFETGGLDGTFGMGTKEAVMEFQRVYGLTMDGAVGCDTWRKLTENTVKIGRTDTVID